MSIFLGGNNAIFPTVASVWDEEKSHLWSPTFYWQYQNRAPNSCRSQYPWTTLWTLSRIGSGDPSVPLSVLGQDASDFGLYEPHFLGEAGNMRLYFFTGTCKNDGGTPLGGAIIQLFRTSDDLFITQTTADSNGNYQIGTPYNGVNHYLTAYYASSPDLSGTTVNTLQPAL